LFFVHIDKNKKKSIKKLYKNILMEKSIRAFLFIFFTVGAWISASAAPILIEVTEVASLSSDNTPLVIINSTEDVDLHYSGSCGGGLQLQMIEGNQGIDYPILPDGIYADCTIQGENVGTGEFSNILSLSAFEIDTTSPVILFVDDVSVMPSNSDMIEIHVLETSPNVSTYKYGFSSDAICDGGDMYTNSFVNNVPFGITNEVNNGKYICVTAEDLAGNTSYKSSTNRLSIDSVAPIITEVTAVISPTIDTTPDYVFNSDEIGTIVYGGDCSSPTSIATIGDNSITFNELINGVHSNCTVTVTDLVGNVSATLNVMAFEVDTISPVFSTIGVSTNNVYDPSYANAGSELMFTLVLEHADSYGGNGSIDFSIGGVSRTINFEQVSSVNRNSTYTAKYILAGENGNIEIMGITFDDFLGHGIHQTSFVVGQAPTPTVIVDTDFPDLISAAFVSSGNSGSVPHHSWVRLGQKVTYTLNFGEDIIRENLISSSLASNIGSLSKEFNIASYGTSDTIIFIPLVGDNGAIVATNINFSVVDRAGNSTIVSQNDVNALFTNTISSDTTRPTVSNVSIFSNNALDTSLAKTNDTITVALNTSDNLSPNISLHGSSRIFNEIPTDNVTGAMGASTMALFTDGNEATQQQVPFQVRIIDEAGNLSSIITSTSDGSTVRFDRTNPVIQNVYISAVSQDGSSYLGDLPTYYARQGDAISLRFEATDWVDIVPGISGNFFGIPTTFVKTNPACNGSIGWCEWSASILNTNGLEGIVDFDVLVLDNAGNGDGSTNSEVHITGTTDGSRVIFDKTRPQNPTDVTDLGGSSTTSFKGGTEAIFSWSNDTDSLPLNGNNAGVWKYYIALTNPDNGGEFHRGSASNFATEELSLWDNSGNLIGTKQFDGTISQLAPWIGKFIPPRNITPIYNPYDFRMIVVDKAGNKSFDDFGDPTQLAGTQPQVVYEQPYTITIYGVLTNEEGTPIPNAIVQVAARYGEFCNQGVEICADMTDDLGRYSILVNKNQDYNITFFANGYYLNKKDRNILADHFQLNISLIGFESIHEKQEYQQIVRFVLSEKIQIGQRWEYVQFDIYTNSGQITTRQEGQAVVVTSLSSITKIRQIIPYQSEFILSANTPITLDSTIGSITISSNGNEWSFFGGGRLISHNGHLSEFDSDHNENEYGNRISIGYTPAKGVITYSGDRRDERVLNNKIWTREEVEEDNKKIDAGNAPKILTYTNRNGYEIFAGYRSGRLPMEERGERYRNRVRIGTRATKITEGSFATKIQEIKETVGTDEIKEVLIQNKQSPIRKISSVDAAISADARSKYVSQKIDKFARYDENSGRKPSTLKSKQYSSIYMRVGGKSVSMNKVMQRESGGY
jgi:hypothetical protein